MKRNVAPPRSVSSIISSPGRASTIVKVTGSCPAGFIVTVVPVWTGPWISNSSMPASHVRQSVGSA
jgi:hypothetical protein